MAKTGGPVRNRQPCVVAGDQPARNNEQKGQNGNKDGKAMVSSVVGRGTQKNSSKPSILAFSQGSTANPMIIEST
jgi:hypothetical protein